jgi:ABC-type antimicrobial peptide transport system permease subunit
MRLKHFVRTLGLARRNFIANFRRNFFSILTVAFGALAIGAIFTVNENVNDLVNTLMSRSGGPNLYISLRARDAGFDPADLNAIKSLTSLRYMSRDQTFEVNAVRGAKSHPIAAVAVDAGYKLARSVQLIEGQYFSDWDLQQPSANAVISEQGARALGLENPVGSTLPLFADGHTTLVQIIGVAIPLYDKNDRGTIWLAESTFDNIRQTRTIDAFTLGVSTYKHLSQFEEDVRALLEPKYKEHIEIHNPQGFFASLRAEYMIFIYAGAVIGLLSLLAGSAGVMNIMLMSIQLRTREIGLYRALGFPSQVVLLAFLSETLMVVMSGGMLGAIAGTGFGLLIVKHIMEQQGLMMAPRFSEEAFVFALASAFAVGFVFAYIPARRASSLDPVVALKT